MNEYRLADYLEHMQRAATDVRSLVEGLDRPAFLADKRTQSAVIMSLVIVGEAATKLMEHHAQFVARHPEVPWRNMGGMRDRIAHGCFDINLDVVWETVPSALPTLLNQLRVISPEPADKN